MVSAICSLLASLSIACWTDARMYTSNEEDVGWSRGLKAPAAACGDADWPRWRMIIVVPRLMGWTGGIRTTARAGTSPRQVNSEAQACGAFWLDAGICGRQPTNYFGARIISAQRREGCFTSVTSVMAFSHLAREFARSGLSVCRKI